MGIVDTIKDTIGIVQKIDNIELYQKLIELQQQAWALVDENRLLTERLSTHAALTVRDNAYWNGEDGPFCTRCWDGEYKLVHLHVRRGFWPLCPACKTVAPDPTRPTPRPSISHKLSGWG